MRLLDITITVSRYRVLIVQKPYIYNPNIYTEQTKNIRLVQEKFLKVNSKNKYYKKVAKTLYPESSNSIIKELKNILFDNLNKFSSIYYKYD